MSQPVYTFKKLRLFSSVIGLMYRDVQGDIQTWTHADVKTQISNWVQQHYPNEQLCVHLSQVETLLYCFNGNMIEEPAIRVSGEFDPPLTDEDMKTLLVNFFGFLKTALRQQSVKFQYQGYQEGPIVIRVI